MKVVLEIVIACANENNVACLSRIISTLASFSFGSSEPYRGTIFLLRFVALQPFQLTTKCKDASVTKKENSFENIK